MSDYPDDLIERAARAMERRGETEGIAWGALDLSYDTYEALARAVLDAVATDIAEVARHDERADHLTPDQIATLVAEAEHRGAVKALREAAADLSAAGFGEVTPDNERILALIDALETERAKVARVAELAVHLDHEHVEAGGGVLTSPGEFLRRALEGGDDA